MRAAQRDTAYLLAANDLIPNLKRRLIALATKIKRLAIKFAFKAFARKRIVHDRHGSRDINFLALIGQFGFSIGMRCLQLVISADVNLRSYGQSGYGQLQTLHHGQGWPNSMLYDHDLPRSTGR